MKETEPVIHSDPGDYGRHARIRRHQCTARDTARLPRGRAAFVEFLEDFPTVTKEQAVAALEQANDVLLPPSGREL